MTTYTLANLRNAENIAPALAADSVQEVRFPALDAERTGLALMAVKPGRRQAVAHRHDEAEEIYATADGPRLEPYPLAHHRSDRAENRAKCAACIGAGLAIAG